MCCTNVDWLAELKTAGEIDLRPSKHLTSSKLRPAAVDHPYNKAEVASAMGYELSLSASRFASWSFVLGRFSITRKTATVTTARSVEAMNFLQGLFLSGCAQLVDESYGDQDDLEPASCCLLLAPALACPLRAGR
jgi:multiple sugar transport system substrate-binding protein/sn-glycerol 3-phosphate transport system substrate-binding protein